MFRGVTTLSDAHKVYRINKIFNKNYCDEGVSVTVYPFSPRKKNVVENYTRTVIEIDSYIYRFDIPVWDFSIKTLNNCLESCFTGEDIYPVLN